MARKRSLRSNMAARPGLVSGRLCSLTLSAKIHGWPRRTMLSAVGRRRRRTGLAEELIDAAADRFWHLDERGPFAAEAFAGEFFGGVKAELGADGELAG